MLKHFLIYHLVGIVDNKKHETFVDTEEVGKKYNNSESNFHISTAGHNALANYILGYMYHNKFEANNSTERKNISPIEISNKGAVGVIESTILDYKQSYARAMQLSEYPRERELAIADEHKRETEIFQKVLLRRTK